MGVGSAKESCSLSKNCVIRSVLEMDFLLVGLAVTPEAAREKGHR